MAEKKRTFGYKDSVSKSGSFSPHLGKATSERLTKYCKSTNQNRTRFIEKCINEKLDVLEMEYLESLSKEELIELYLNK